MKKLLVTTALCSLFSASAFAAHGHKHHAKTVEKQPEAAAVAEAKAGPVLKIGGLFTGEVGYAKQKKEYTTLKNGGVTPNGSKAGIDTRTAVYAHFENATDSGMKYGAHVGVQGTSKSSSRAGSSSLDTTYMFMENNMGRVELGSNSSAAEAMVVGADSIARGAGGIDGTWILHPSLATTGAKSEAGKISENGARGFKFGPSLVAESHSGSDPRTGHEKSRKLTFYTPEMNGFQAGISYIPDYRNSGQDSYVDLAEEYAGKYYSKLMLKNVFAAGVSYKHSMGDHKFKVSAVGEYGKTRSGSDADVSVNQAKTELVANGTDNSTKAKYHDLKSYILGAQWNYREYGLAASYGNQGKSLMLKNEAEMWVANSFKGATGNTAALGTNEKIKGTHFWTVGASYNQGPAAMSLTYMQSKRNTNKMKLISLGADYMLAPGLNPFAEVSYFKMDMRKQYFAPSAAAGADDKKLRYVNDKVSDAILAGSVAPNPDNTKSTSIAAGANVDHKAQNKGTVFILGTRVSF